MKCTKCKKEFEKSVLTTAKNAKGKNPVSKTAKLYCPKCATEMYYRNVIIDRLDNFHKNRYKSYGASDRKCVMGKIGQQLSNLEKEGYTYTQINAIMEYILKQNVEISDNILGLVPYYYMQTKEHYSELQRIKQNAKFGTINPKNIDISNNKHNPNKDFIKVSKIELL